ncbi:hypothetical protein TTHERM_00299750 (macronuclear) [Tetrahymena thermophila SB210]|uniref:Uncharacterized protein n=1 Tax=Tetrahymena thermophila (strain SB210) TaxID=312017 RepID=I7M3T3_TETTS|nr:hypothetical protein TTHERM_00299750 [Tetrahymena thermophila SB210]EAS04257.1 hypothetical protein TTHERM_00299750 [Tetrahymena thermophila SB210]|eukprot:XP_001024502.1 hypothetical protein TTHERM_00299750 [Tetrahymena thermophila SB210]
MLKKDVFLRKDVYTVYSSEKQERMKVYFQLTEEYNECMEKCTNLTDESKQECVNECEKIYDQYVDKLETRYQGENAQRLNMEVKNLPTFDKKIREERTGFFYQLFGLSFNEFLYGKDKKAATQQGDFEKH